MWKHSLINGILWLGLTSGFLASPGGSNSAIACDVLDWEARDAAGSREQLSDPGVPGIGDINCNGLHNEVTDAEMFADYFIHSLAAFNNHSDCSTITSDLNEDNVPLTIADFVVLLRHVTGDPLETPLLEPSPNLTSIYLYPGSKMITVRTDDTLAAVSLRIFGDVTPYLSMNQLYVDMDYAYDYPYTDILVWSLNPGAYIRSGNLVSFAGSGYLRVVAAATYYGQPVVVGDPTDVGEHEIGLVPGKFYLHANYPNPFNPSTTISFDLYETARLEISVFNTAGQLVCRLADGGFPAGSHSVQWDGTDKSGASVSSGVYLYRLQAGESVVSRKMVLLK